MIVIMPLGGLGERFKKHGYTEPKPLINVLGKLIISWLLDNLSLNKIKKIVIPYNKELEKYRFENLLESKYGNITSFLFKKLEYDTDGPIESILEGLNMLEKTNEDDCPILSLDCDNFYYDDIITIWGGNNSVLLFEDNNNSSCYSYVTITDNRIDNIIEKEKISNYACSGGYGFKSWKELKYYSEYVIKNNIRQKNEFYVSTVIKTMIEANHIFLPNIINKSNYICLGTPLHVRIFSNDVINNPEIMKGVRICFDLDNTLVTFPKVRGDYSTVEPIQNTINLAHKLKKLGCTIIIYTARHMKTCEGNQGKIMKKIGNITINTLDKFNIPYDELYFGKPWANFYIDDLAINAFEDIEKKIGIYKSEISPRKFNSISDSTLKTIKKCSGDLSGEIYYYQNIPPNIRDIFPMLIKCDTIRHKWFEIEKIEGVPINKLYLSEQFNEDLLKYIISIFTRIHDCKVDDPSIDIYVNYCEKIQKRYNNYDYNKFDSNNNYYTILIEKLKEYQKECRGTISVIHGDPVMTNILIDNEKKIKFIDMRGKLGNNLTICGDKMYDWAKLYQSLIGYDEILEEKTVNSTYKNYLIKIFEKLFIETFGDRLHDLRLITSSLLFSLIPLHDNIKCQQYYNLGKRLMLK